LPRQDFVARRFPCALHSLSIRESVVRVWCECSAKPVGNHAGKRLEVGALAKLTREYLLGIVFAERRIARHDEVHDRRKCKQIGSRTLRLTQQLLGRRECWGTGGARRVFTGDVCDSEISDSPPVIPVDQDVLGLQVSMQDSVRMRDYQSVQNSLDLSGNFGELPWTRSLDETGDAAFFGELHRVP